MIDVAARLDRTPEAVWEDLVDTRRWPTWGPTVAGATLDHGGTRIRAGSTGRVRTALGVSLPFRVTAWEEGGRWAWAVAGVPATAHRVAPAPGGGCVATFEVPVWAPGYVLVCRVALRRLGRGA